MAKPSWEDRLAERAEDYEKVEVSYKKLPDGKYQARLAELMLEDRDWGLQLMCLFEDINGAGSVRKWIALEPDDEDGSKLWFTKVDLQNLGFNGPLPGVILWVESEWALGNVYEIGVKTKAGDQRDYTNVYINRLVSTQGGEAPIPGAPPEPDESVPF